MNEKSKKTHYVSTSLASSSSEKRILVDTWQRINMIATSQRHPRHPNIISSSANLSALYLNDPTQPPPLTATGLRAQLNHFRPRQAYFHVKVQIHQISIDSVPLIRGEFGVGWKFKGVLAPPGTKHGPGFLGIVTSRLRAGRLRCDSNIASKRKAKQDEEVESLESGESRQGRL